jgi:hypothetical protein
MGNPFLGLVVILTGDSANKVPYFTAAAANAAR